MRTPCLHALPPQIVYRNYVDVSVAVASPRGLVVPVLRNVETQSLAEIEGGLAALAAKARADKISIEEMTGGTFTISNGGVFGSLMGTPIINQPQSAILGMHATKQRAVVINVRRGVGRRGAFSSPHAVLVRRCFTASRARWRCAPSCTSPSHTTTGSSTGGRPVSKGQRGGRLRGGRS